MKLPVRSSDNDLEKDVGEQLDGTISVQVVRVKPSDGDDDEMVTVQ